MSVYVYVFIHTGISSYVYVEQIHIYICSYGQFNTGCILKKVIVVFFFN